MVKSIIEQELEKYERDGWSGDASALSVEDALKAIKKALKEAEYMIDEYPKNKGIWYIYYIKTKDVKQILNDCFGAGK